MLLDDFSYHLPKRLIAQKPLEKRSSSRLMVVERATGRLMHSSFRELPGYLERGDVLVVNRSRVIPARLFARRATGGRVEVLFVVKHSGQAFGALVRARGKLRIGEELVGEDGSFTLRVAGMGDRGEILMEVSSNITLEELLELKGHVPIPPYIKRADKPVDRERYQTIFAVEDGSVAAPTAGLHFDEAVLEGVKAKGVKILSLVLHVGPGTFLPLKEREIEKNVLFEETYLVSGQTIKEIAGCKERGKKVIAVGTTVTRVLESAFIEGFFDGAHRGGDYVGETNLFIYPGYKFRVVDRLITNFHLPKSSLFLLVCAFLGRENTLSCYKEAVEREYRFYSYGDAMLIR